MASIYQINTSDGGVPKVSVDEAEIGINGIVGDRQADLEHHGGLDRALCLYSLGVIEALRAEGNEIGPGTTGENLTITGLQWELVKPGTRLRIGQTIAQVTSFTTPCSKIAASFSDGMSARIHPVAHPGWSRAYARVIIGGVIRAGDEVELIE